MVSSNDVAKLAGVSQATVSRVLNNSEKVNAATTKKVNDAIQELNYRPNAAARSLISRKSGIIALMCGPLDDPENAEFSGKTIAYAREKGFITELHIQDPNEPAAVFESIGRSQAEGILAGPIMLVGAGVELLEKSGIPYAFCGMEYQGNGSFISMDNRAAGSMAADYIYSLNHRVVGWLGGNSDEPRLHDRYTGFLERMKQQEIEILSATDAISDWDPILSAMMARKDRPTAIVAATDAIGAYAIDFLIAYGYSIPEDISIVGIGNSKQAAMNYLGLTSVGLPGETDIFKAGVDQLIARINGDSIVPVPKGGLMPELFERKSAVAI
ncbi:LacI family DNA-binding transcriptional regulator [Metaplanococcus flavidus]|uniref:LacI family DNA-binding transcriptional regulator n=1 Tax=Metaplanococcus flavidus TaxID=569883 RepID=A0ABW3LAB0_9BACL